jgi:peptide/nickel transport system permease protein
MVTPERSAARDAMRRLWRHPAFVVGAVVLGVLATMTVGGILLSPYNPNAISVRAILAPPQPAHWAGADHLGRDVFTRLCHGALISLLVGLAVVATSAIAGTLLGALAGYFRVLDAPIMRLMDALMAFPAILLALGIASALGPSLVNVVAALTVAYTPETARIVRSSVLVLRNFEFVDAARAAGAGDGRIVLRHLLPNAMSPLVVQLTAVFAYAVLSEATLSFLGVGLPPPTPSWGTIIADGRNYIVEAWWICFFPGLAITLAVLALNLVGDGLRDILDPRLRVGQ